MSYSLVVTDRSFVPQGEVRNASSFAYFRGLSKSATLSFQVRLDNPQAARLAACDGYIKMYRNKVLRGVMPIISAEEVAERETQSVAVTCADASWQLSHRIAGKSTTGTLYTTVTDRATIAKAMVDTANTESETGISTSAYTWSSGSAITYKVGPYVNLMSSFQELGGALDGFDWLVHALEPASGKYGSMQVQPIIGTAKGNAVFEYGPGTRSNVLSYGITTTRDQQATRVYHTGNDPASVVTGINSTAETTWGRLEDVASGDFTDTTMRQKLVDEHVRVRGNPRTLVRMTPHIDPGVTGKLPLPFDDYDAGDTITARFMNGKNLRFAGLLRVYGFRVAVDQGFERVELLLEEDAA